MAAQRARGGGSASSPRPALGLSERAIQRDPSSVDDPASTRRAPRSSDPGSPHRDPRSGAIARCCITIAWRHPRRDPAHIVQLHAASCRHPYRERTGRCNIRHSRRNGRDRADHHAEALAATVLDGSATTRLSRHAPGTCGPIRSPGPGVSICGHWRTTARAVPRGMAAPDPVCAGYALTVGVAQASPLCEGWALGHRSSCFSGRRRCSSDGRLPRSLVPTHGLSRDSSRHEPARLVGLGPLTQPKSEACPGAPWNRP